MSEQDRTTWLTKKLQLWVITITAITSTGGLVYAGSEYLNRFATNDDVATVQRQMTELHFQSQISSYEEQKMEIQDKIVDGTASNSDRKKLHRLDLRIQNLKGTLNSIR